MVYISNSDNDENPYSFRVQGIGTEQEINLQGGTVLTDIPSGTTTTSDPTGTNFGPLPTTKTFTIQNTGTSPLSLWSAWSSLTDYTVSFSPSTIPAGGTGTLTVVYNPTGTGTRTATISLSNNDANEGTYTFRVSGTATDKEINVKGNAVNITSGSTTINVDRNTDFGSTDVNTGSVTNNFTIENTGFNSLSITAVSSNSGDFIVSFPATTIPAYSSVTLPVTFNPTVAGTRNGVITINNNDSNEGTYTFAVRGVGTEQEINVQGGAGPSNIASGTTSVSVATGTNFGSSAVTRTFTVQNTGTSNLNISSVSSTLADYVVSISSNIVAPGSTATLTIVFTPNVVGTRAATITILPRQTL